MGIPGEDQWILTAEEYADLAAFKGTPLDEELESRRVAAEFIQKLGMRLKLYESWWRLDHEFAFYHY